MPETTGYTESSEPRNQGLSFDEAIARHREQVPEPASASPQDGGQQQQQVEPAAAPAPPRDELDEMAALLEEEERSKDGQAEDPEDHPDDALVPRIQSLRDVAEYVEMPLDDFMTTVVMDVGDEQVPLRQVVQRARTHADLEKDRALLAQDRESFDAEALEARRRFADMGNQAAVYKGVIAQLAQARKEQINAQYGALPWDEMRQAAASDPRDGRFANATTAYQQAIATVDQELAAVQSHIDQALEKAGKGFQEERSNLIAKGEQVFRAETGITTDAEFREQRDAMHAYARENYKVDDGDFDGMWADPRIASLLRKAMKWDALEARRAEIRAPRDRRQPQRSGAAPGGRAGDPTKARAVKEARRQLEESGSFEAALALRRAQRM